jgi:histidyl-tRNA synthetase
LKNLGIPEGNYRFDMTIVRGLDYYTGTIYETIFPEYKGLGSVCGGGRYDNLTSSFSTQKMPGVGVSIGLTRLFPQLKEAGLIKSGQKTVSQAVILPMTDNMAEVFKIADQFRREDVKVEIYLEEAGASKKMKYADNLGIPYVIMIGDSEIESGRLTIKNMKTGEQESVSLAQAVDIVAR